MESSIISDLRKYAGPIMARKPPHISIQIDHDESELSQSDDSESSQSDDSELSDRDAGPEYTIDSVAEMVPAPYVVVRDAQGVVGDLSTIAIRCPRGHIHAHYITDIIAQVLKCKTCTTGSKFAKLVCSTAEEVIGHPFQLTTDGSYHNLKLKASIEIMTTAGVDNVTGGVTDATPQTPAKLTIHRTVSIRKITSAIDQLHRAIGGTPRPKKKSPLVYTSELSEIAGVAASVNDTPARELCLENCK